MRKYLVLLTVCISGFVSNAQNVGIGVPNPQNKLHVGGGFRLDTLTGVGGAGLVRHDANGVVYGIKFSGNSNDVLRGDGSFGALNIDGAIGWLLNGNSGTNPATNFLGTTDNQPLTFRVNNIRHGYISGNNILFGSNAGLLITTGKQNIAIGSGALNNSTNRNKLIAIGDSALFNISTSNFSFETEANNIAIGYKAMYASTSGTWNVAIGSGALQNSSSNGNAAVGYNALNKNTSGYSNAAFGNAALLVNTTGRDNTGLGYNALNNNITGSENVAVGAYALNNNNSSDNTAVGYRAHGVGLSGSYNTAVGAYSLEFNGGSLNSGFGYEALSRNTVGLYNSAFGANALRINQNGDFNCAFGTSALSTSNTPYHSAFGFGALRLNTVGLGNTAIGMQSLNNNISGSWNTAIGMNAGFSLPNNVSNVTVVGQSVGWNTTLSNHVNIGNFSQTWIGGQTGWFHYSDKRIKNDIKDDVPGLAFISRLKPITYHVDIRKQEEIASGGKIETTPELIKPTQKDWEGKYDVEKIKMTGFFAQDVEEAAKAINYSFSGVHNPKNGGLHSLDYSAFVVPLVKAVQEQQTIIEKQQKLIDELLKRVEALEKK